MQQHPEVPKFSDDLSVQIHSVLIFHADTAYVRIFVTDVNDNAPAFAQPMYEVSVEEDKEVGYVLITVTANDEDEGQSDSGFVFGSLSAWLWQSDTNSGFIPIVCFVL